MAVAGLLGILFFFFIAVFAPLIANGRPLLLLMNGHLSSPASNFLFSPDSNEFLVEKIFNFLLLLLPAILIIRLILPKKINKYYIVLIFSFLIMPFFIFSKSKLEKTDWRKIANELKPGDLAIFAPIPYGPFENVSESYKKTDRKYLFGTDQNGRDVFSRMIYGARVSLAVGLFATSLTMIIGIVVGMITGYFGGKLDIAAMRIVEIVMCFPTFLLLLILMAIMLDYNYTQSILLVILVIGLTSWADLSRIVRGEILQQRSMSYIKSCESLGLPVWRTMFFHLLPNVMGPILVAFTFGVAGAILTESGLSFLGFGVQPPTASWGELLRQSFSNPLEYWHLILWPGLAIFLSVVSFNFAGEGIRHVFDPRSETE